MPQNDPVYHDDGGNYADLLHPVQVLKNHLRLIHGSMILYHIQTRFLRGGGDDLYAEQLTQLIRSIYCTLLRSASASKRFK